MKANDLADAQQIAKLIEEGSASKRDVLALLIYIRDEIPNGMVKDLAHSVAHTTRDRGYAFDQIERFASTMIRVFQSGGMLPVEPIFPSDRLIKELSRHLHSLGVRIDRPQTYRNRGPLLACLEELLEGVSLELKNPRIESCKFERLGDENNEKFGFVLKTSGLTGVINVPEHVRIACPVFDEN